MELGADLIRIYGNPGTDNDTPPIVVQWADGRTAFGYTAWIAGPSRLEPGAERVELLTDGPVYLDGRVDRRTGGESWRAVHRCDATRDRAAGVGGRGARAGRDSLAAGQPALLDRDAGRRGDALMPSSPKAANAFPEMTKTPVGTPVVRSGTVHLQRGKDGVWSFAAEGEPFVYLTEVQGLVTCISLDPGAPEYLTITATQWDAHAVGRAEGSGAPSAGAAEAAPDGVEGSKTQ